MRFFRITFITQYDKEMGWGAITFTSKSYPSEKAIKGKIQSTYGGSIERITIWEINEMTKEDFQNFTK